MFLSPRYEIVRFKSTTVYLNRLVIEPRIAAPLAIQAVKGDEEEAIFMKDRSVFRDFREDSVAYIRRCLDQDLDYGKIARLFKKDEGELDQVKEVLYNHYERLNNIFLAYAGASSYPTISMNDFTSFANQCKLLDGKYINLSALDLLFDVGPRARRTSRDVSDLFC